MIENKSNTIITFFTFYSLFSVKEYNKIKSFQSIEQELIIEIIYHIYFE